MDDNRTKEALRYIGQLTGSLNESIHQINTGHPVVNVLLNQKYQSAREQQISMTMTMNNLSELSLSEEDIVTLLANLLDNAIEACLKLHGDRRIQLKMVLEEEELFLSIRNPVEWEVKISGKTAAAAKEKSGEHGLGLGNVDAVIRKTEAEAHCNARRAGFVLPLSFCSRSAEAGQEPKMQASAFFAVRPPICAACIDETRSDQYNEGRGIQELVNQPRTGGYYETKSKAFYGRLFDNQYCGIGSRLRTERDR